MIKHTTVGLILFVLLISINSVVWAGNVTIPYSFGSGTKAMASEVNANFNKIETEINDNVSRIVTLEAANSAFSLGEALLYLPESDAANTLKQKAKTVFDSTLMLFNNGFKDADTVCRWAKILLNSAYMASLDDTDRLAALDDYEIRMDEIHQRVLMMFQAGVVPIQDVQVAEYYLLSAQTLVEGFKAKIDLSK